MPQVIKNIWSRQQIAPAGIAERAWIWAGQKLHNANQVCTNKAYALHLKREQNYMFACMGNLSPYEG